MKNTHEPPGLIDASPLTLPGDGHLPELQAHYVARLHRLLQVRRQHLGELNQEGIWLLDRSIFATYCDCVEVGAGLAAQDALRSSPPAEGTERALGAPSRRSRRA